jgi:hypothetical protein
MLSITKHSMTVRVNYLLPYSTRIRTWERTGIQDAKIGGRQCDTPRCLPISARAETTTIKTYQVQPPGNPRKNLRRAGLTATAPILKINSPGVKEKKKRKKGKGKIR